MHLLFIIDNHCKVVYKNQMKKKNLTLVTSGNPNRKKIKQTPNEKMVFFALSLLGNWSMIPLITVSVIPNCNKENKVKVLVDTWRDNSLIITGCVRFVVGK